MFMTPRFVLVLLCIALVSTAHAQSATQPSDAIAVVASFSEELTAIKQSLKVDATTVVTQSVNGVEFQSVQHGGQHLVLFVTGMSLVNAAMSMQLALDHFDVRAVLFSGIAGGVDPSLGPGDVVIPRRWHYHSEAVYINETSPGVYNLPDYFKPKHGHFGMIFPEHVTVKREGMKDWQQLASFDADERLLAAARTAAGRVRPVEFGRRGCQIVIGGDGVSGTVFCDNAAYRAFVFETWKAQCLDMESTAIAQVCWQNRKPFLIVRGLSDLAGGQAGKNTVDEYLKVAADNAARVAAEIVKELGD